MLSRVCLNILQARRSRPEVPLDPDKGAAALVWMVGGQPRVVYRFMTSGERITAIDLIADPARLSALDLMI